MEEKILLFLKTHPLISIKPLEKKCKIPRTILNRALKDGKLPKKHTERLYEALKNYGLSKN